MTTQPGPEWLRSVARSAADTLTGRVHISEVYANELAAAWEADRAALAMYSKLDCDDGLASSNRLLAACERGDGIDQHAAPDIMAARAEIVAQRAALERARALLKRIEWQDATTRPIYCDIVVCVACGRDHPNHKPGCDLAALLAAGGAA